MDSGNGSSILVEDCFEDHDCVVSMEEAATCKLKSELLEAQRNHQHVPSHGEVTDRGFCC